MTVYKHRDDFGAEQEVRAILSWLALPQGASVLDLCCGTGRHAVALKKMGFSVTGVDLSETLLAEAMARGEEGIRWVRGDMRNVPLAGPFDAVFNLFTSFGYFESDAENQKVLSEMHRLLRPGGKFVIDFLNPPYVAAHLVPKSVRRDGPYRIEERREIRGAFVVKTILVSERGSAPRMYKEQIKMYGLNDFRRMLALAGLKLTGVYGDYDGSAYSKEQSRRLILTGYREGENYEQGKS